MVRKAFAASCIVVILGAQTWAIFPPGRERDWHWPFLDYPMYSSAHHLGDSIILQDLRAVPCDTLHGPITIQASTLHIDLGRFWPMVDEIAHAEAPDVARIASLTKSAIREDVCALEVWRQVLIVGERGVRVYDRPWTKFREWMMKPESDQRSVGP